MWIVGIVAAFSIACNLLVSVPGEGAPELGGDSDAADGARLVGAGDAALDSDSESDADSDAGARKDGDAAAMEREGGPLSDAGDDLPPAIVIASQRSFPLSLTVDPVNDAVYWTESNGGVFKVSKDGGPITPLKEPDDASSAQRIVTDGLNLYWADAAHGTIAYVGVDGGSPSVLAASPGSSPGGLATDGTYVYWSDLAQSTILRTPVAGPHPSAAQLIVSGVDPKWGNLYANDVLGMTATASWLLWTEDSPSFGFVYSLPLGTDPASPIVLTGGNEPNSDSRFIAGDGANAYWTNSGASPAAVFTEPSNASGAEQALSWGEDRPGAIAVSGSHDLYWVDDGTSNTVRRSHQVEGIWTTASTIALAASPTAIGLDADAVYWANGTGSGSIAKVRIATLP